MRTPAREFSAVRLAPLVASIALGATAPSCGGDGTAGGISMRVDRIVLSRLDAQLHLRVFAKGGYTCDEGTGRIRAGDADASDFPGRLVRPDQRCGPEWNGLRAMFGEATPVDTCFSRDDARADVSLPEGRYLVLVEGSGDIDAAGGGTRKITLGSGCIEVEAGSGATINRTLRMIEQADTSGTCGDGVVNSNELCDSPGDTSDCNARCRFPERTVSPAAAGNRRRPAVAWAPTGMLAVAWHSAGDSRDDVWVHFFDDRGVLIRSPEALANDYGLDLTAASEQRNVRLAVGGAALVGAWETAEYSTAYDLDGVTFASIANPLPVPRGYRVTNANTGATHPNRTNVAVAATNARAVFVFENGAGGLSVASTALPASAMPAAETNLALTGAAAMMPSAPSITPLNDAGFVLAWTAGLAGSRDVYAVRLNLMGAMSGSIVQVNSTDASDQDQVTVAASATDVFFAFRDASRADAQDSDGTTVRVRRANINLEFDQPDRVAVSTTAGDQANPSVAVGDGAALVAWEQGDGTVRGRLFSSTSDSVLLNRISGDSGDFLVNASGDEMGPGRGPRAAPAVAFGGARRFVVAWEDQGTRNVHYRTLIK